MRREGRMTDPQSAALAKYWPEYGLEIRQGAVDFTQLFGRTAQVCLEIGFGMGDALLSMAEANPHKDYLGVEVHRPGIGALFLRMSQTEATNIRVYQEDVVEVLVQCVPEASLSEINIYFPDPWPKRRHHKRRLIQPPFVELLRHKLKLGGRLHLATDWENYAQQMMQVLSGHAGFNNLVGQGNFVENQQVRLLTKFEKRGLRLGHPVWDMIFIKL